MTPEERLVRSMEASLATYDKAKVEGERPAPAWLQRHIDEVREGIAGYRKAHPREDAGT